MIRRSITPALVVAIAVTAAAGCGTSQPKTTNFRNIAAPPTGDLIDSRFAATATLLPNGQVLLAGGVANEGPASASAELFDPATGAFTRTGSLADSRAYHTATRLKDGRVLLAGGVGTNGVPKETAEIYDPATNKFSITGSLTEARYNHAAVLLANGKVLITGGDSASDHIANLDTAEIYDPAAGTFSATGNIKRFYDPENGKFWYQGKMLAPHAKHTATLLRDGNVLIAGGGDAGGVATSIAEIYDISSGKFIATGHMKYSREEHGATLLPNGDVLITGGLDAKVEILSTAELYDPTKREFALTTAAFHGTGSNMRDGRYEHTATLMANGKVLIAGGSDATEIVNTAEIYDPSDGAFTCIGGLAGPSSCAAAMTESRTYAAAAALPDGEVLIAGGYNFGFAAAHNPAAAQGTLGGSSVPFSVLWSAEVFNPAAGIFTSTKAIAHAHFAAASKS